MSEGRIKTLSDVRREKTLSDVRSEVQNHFQMSESPEKDFCKEILREGSILSADNHQIGLKT